MKAHVIDEIEVLRWCIDWLARLDRGGMAVVNLRPDTEWGSLLHLASDHSKNFENKF
jgi:hypothetical protein